MFTIKLKLYNSHLYSFILVDCKAWYRWVFLLKNKEGPTVTTTVKGFFKGLKNRFKRYPLRFHYDGGKEVENLLKQWLFSKSITFTTFNAYVYE